MPLTKVDDADRKRQRRAASPSERGRRSERAPRSKARNAERMRQERAQAAHFPQIRRVKLKARRRALLGSKLGTQTEASEACAKSPIFRRCDGSSFKQEGTRPRAHPPLRSLVCCVDNGTGARSAAKMSTACLRRFVEGGRNGLWPRNRERFFRGPQHGAFNLRVL